MDLWGRCCQELSWVFFPPWVEVGYEVDGFILSLFALAELDIKLRGSWLGNSAKNIVKVLQM